LGLSLAGLGAAAADEPPARSAEPGQLRKAVQGTWECVLPAEAPKGIRHIKHVTDRHYTWVTYDSANHQVLATSGGTWTVKEGKYEEKCQFATATHEHLRGKTFAFRADFEGDRWVLRVSPDGEIHVDETWNHVKPEAGQKPNTEPRGRNLLGTWEGTVAGPAPKAARIVKHVTPTNWTWVIFDGENKMVLAAMGGTWSLKGNQYEETVDFATNNIQGAGGRSFAYSFKVDEGRWFLNPGPEFDAQSAESWKLVK
jgi:hypothetical protein